MEPNKGYIRKLAFTEVSGYDEEKNPVGTIRTRVESNHGWVTNKQARADLKELGAVKFKRRNVWEFEPWEA